MKERQDNLIARRRARHGFSSVEMTMIVAVLAILTLLAVPVYRNRVETAREGAAKSDMGAIRKAQLLAYGETGHYFRLNDLDNNDTYTTSATSVEGDPLEISDDNQIPVCTWNRELTLGPGGEREKLKHAELLRWNGPYLNYANFELFDEDTSDGQDITDIFSPFLFRLGTEDGPILILDGSGPQNAEDWSGDKYPLDPWGNPYLFFGPGQMIPGDARFDDYNDSLIVSLGPNGVPGGDDGKTVVAESYWREGPASPTTEAVLGTGDDLTLRF